MAPQAILPARISSARETVVVVDQGVGASPPLGFERVSPPAVGKAFARVAVTPPRTQGAVTRLLLRLADQENVK